jgi:beta-glucosidase
MRIYALFLMLLASVFSPLAIGLPSGAEKSQAKTMNTFINKLIAQMTVYEKAGQLTQYTAEMSVTGSTIHANYRADIIKGQVGSVFNAYTPPFTRQLQEIAVNESRLKIPLLFGYDVIHGHKTIFPIPLGESSSWDLPRMELSAKIAAREAAADGIQWTFAPMVDITRDPRWGRVSEGAGEDTWLGSKIAEVRVKGFQGPDIGAVDHVLACVKHFAAYGAPIAGREYNSVDLSDRELFETYLPPYLAAVKADAATVMTSFNDIAGVPSTANAWLVTKLLRDQWKFKGFVVSDYTGIKELVPHGIAADDKAAAFLAFNAGVDMDMQGGLFSAYVPELVKEGKIKMKQLDAAVRRILEVKYKLGLFSDPYRFSNNKMAEYVERAPENLAHARDIGKRSIVLLKNDNNALPLKRKGVVAVIGPYADDHRDLIGNWSGAGDFKQTVTLLEGIKSSAGQQVQVLHARGANLLPAGAFLDTLNKNGGGIVNDPRSTDEMLREAVSTAQKADAVVLALGETQGMSGEAAARTRIRLPENQLALLKELHEKVHRPIILVLFNGRPLVLREENQMADALVEAWFLGSESGHAIADVLFGDYNPSAKLTMTFPYDEGQIPIYYSARNTGRPRDSDPTLKYTSKYIDAPNDPLFPFGFGLSYTKFSYSTPRVSPAKVHTGQKIKVKFTLQNTGTVEGEEVAQLYIRDMVASVTRPVKQLRGFTKVSLKPGESQELEFELNPEDLKFYNQAMKWVSEPGEFKVMVGGNSRDLQESSFQLIQ